MKSVCVMGLGYIGLPTASVLAANGFKVLGVDVDPRIVDIVNAGDIHIEEPGLQTLVRAATNSGNLRAARVPEICDVFFIAVPTPLNPDKTADMRYVDDAGNAIVPFLRPGCLVILESTSPPGTCRDRLRPILETSGLTVGKDILLAHCPERVLPGCILKELIENDRIVGGFDPESAESAREVYATFVEGKILVTDVTTAEMVKVLENTFRDVNIALANEAALMCEACGIDFWEAMNLANRHPRVNVHRAGPGVGGHCISVDPWFLVEMFPNTSTLVRAARDRNDGMPAQVVARVLEILKGIPNPKVAALGLAFKGNVDDVRESPAVEIVERLNASGVSVAANDPYVTAFRIPSLPVEACCAGADCVLLLTDHNDYRGLDPSKLAKIVRTPLLLDTRNLLDHAAWRNAGFQVRVLGCAKM